MKTAIRHIPLVILSVIFIFPMYWLFTTALKSNEAMFVTPPQLFPIDMMWHRFVDVFTYLPFANFIMNSFIISCLNIIGLIITCPLAAYAFSRLRWRGRDVVFGLFLTTMMLPQQVTMIPLYLVYQHLGFINTWVPLILPSFLGNAFYIFLARQFFLTLPFELEDAAKIDGSGYWNTYVKVMLPLTAPIMLTIAIFGFMNSWNDFLGPLIYINSVKLMPIALGLQLFRSLHDQEYGLMMAAATMMTLPPILLFFFAQRQFIKGISFSGLKG
jgi:multiple sugar transport system permease protein